MTETFERDSVAAYNMRAWDRLAREGNRWTLPVSSEMIAEARGGKLSLLLTPATPVPMAWFGDLRGSHVLGLASAGGQQGPCLAAAGAVVTVIDNSPEQLSRDREVASREGLALTTVEGDMRDLSAFKDESFDLVFHPCSNCFVPDVRPVWREAYRVLKRGGHLLAGFVNPIFFALDLAKEREGIVQLKYKIPVSELDYADDEEIRALHADGEPLSFGHTLEDQIGGQLDAGFQLVAMFEDGRPDDPSPIHKLMKAYIATRATKA